ncbi:hypothetical protein FBZ98_10522 [Rhizobium sp. ERR 922]|nr:hypothetical protein FBZ99_112111 [Rhizobium sp. ERR1071]TWB51543.1 hypothetical protein FBZ98_10522 [Rhizobium sp. ERR 922]TWB93965.1 hypothetical protein FBZ97_10522 [Rhizobium sp. ERR 942]
MSHNLCARVFPHNNPPLYLCHNLFHLYPHKRARLPPTELADRLGWIPNPGDAH